MHKIIVKLKPSRYLLIILLLIDMSSIVIILTLPIFWFIKALTIILCLYLTVQHLRHFIWKTTQTAIIGLTHQRHAEYWQLSSHQGKTYPACLLGDSLVASFLIILNFKVPDRKRAISVLILRDSLPMADYKKLITYLRFCIP